MDMKKGQKVSLLLVAPVVFVLNLAADEIPGSGSKPTLAGSPLLSFHPEVQTVESGTFEISVWSGNEWAEIGSIPVDKYFREWQWDLTGWETGPEIRVRLARIGGGASHIDKVALGGRSPRNIGKRLEAKLRHGDEDVIDFSELPPVLIFPTEGAAGAVTPGAEPAATPMVLELRGRIEPEVVTKTPFHYPLDNMYRQITEDSKFYTYELGSARGSLTIDGTLSAESLGVPFFSEYFIVGSGHPQGTTYGWVVDDGATLYVAIDFTADNTRDGIEDYTKVYVRTKAGVAEFSASTEHNRWGRPGFTYTDRVDWEHKVYEFAIPLDEIDGLSTTLDLAFAAYGTAAPPPPLDFYSDLDPNLNGVEPDSGATGTPFTFAVFYADPVNVAAPESSRLWVDWNGDGEISEGTALIVPLLPGSGGLVSILIFAGFAAALTLFGLKHRGARGKMILVGAVAAFAAMGCCLCGEINELYDMATEELTPDWFWGVVFTGEVQADVSPGSYDFRFLYVDSAGNPVPSDVSGPASGTLVFSVN
jgi:hypothetical protein